VGLEDAKDGIELLSNVYYANSPEYRGKTTRFESSFTVQLVAPAAVSVSGFMAGYLSAHAELTAAFVQADYTNKQIGLVDIGVSEVNTTEATFSIKTTVVEVTTNPVPGRGCATYFAEDEDFLDGTAGDGNGPCDYSDPFADYNSMTKTEDALNDLFTQGAEQSAPAGLPVRFTGFVDIDGSTDFEDALISGFEFPNPDDTDPEDGYRDLLFWTAALSSPIYDPCVDNTDINWFTCNMYNIAYYSYHRPAGKIPASVVVFMDAALCPECTYYTHAMDVTYGTPFYTETSTGGGYTNPTDGPYVDFEVNDVVILAP